MRNKGRNDSYDGTWARFAQVLSHPLGADSPSWGLHLETYALHNVAQLHVSFPGWADVACCTVRVQQPTSVKDSGMILKLKHVA